MVRSSPRKRTDAITQVDPSQETPSLTKPIKSWKDAVKMEQPPARFAEAPDGGDAPKAPTMSNGPDAAFSFHDGRNWEASADDLAAAAECGGEGARHLR